MAHLTLKNRLGDSHPLLKALVWIGIGMVLTIGAFALYSALVSDTQSIRALKTLQLLQSLSVFVLPALAAAYLFSNRPAVWLHIDKHPTGKQTLWAVLTILIALPGINLLADLNNRLTLPESMAGIEALLKDLEHQAALLTERFLKADNLWQMLGNLLLIALLPALGEELTFRGVLQGLFTPADHRGVPHVAIWASAILFSAFHMQFYGFVPRMLLGAMFGYTVCLSGSLWVPVLMHMTNNALAVIASYLDQRGLTDSSQWEQFGIGDTAWVGCLSLVLTFGMMVLLYRQTQPHHSTLNTPLS